MEPDKPQTRASVTRTAARSWPMPGKAWLDSAEYTMYRYGTALRY